MKSLLDGDILIYRCGFACQKNTYFVLNDEGELLATANGKREADEYLEQVGGKGVIHKNEVVEPLAHAIQALKTSIDAIVRDSGGKDFDIYLTGEGNFRDKIATIQPYKGNRDPENKPFYYKELREFLVEHYLAIVVDGMEADDALGIHQSTSDPGSTIICSLDKDLDMIPGWHYNWVKGFKYYVNDTMAFRAFYTQLLTGDITDNVRGVPGIGPVKAAKILEGADDEEKMFNACSEAYKGNLIELNENAQLLWIKRTPFDMWVPPV